jgi:hypothetical protein
MARAPDGTSYVLSSIPSGSEFSGLGLKNPLVVSLPLLGYVSCSPPSNWVVAEWVVVAGPLVIGSQGLGIFLAYMSRSSTSNATPQGVVFPLAG